MSEIQIGVSACLLGEQIRYDGGHKRNALLLDEMASHVSFVPVRRELAMFTPLFLVLIAIGTYILVALDSIPAVFGVTDEPFIVFVANAFALLGLRGPNFLVTGLLDRLVYLSTGLSIVLGFIGIKLVLHWGHLHDDRVPEIATTTTSLAVIGAVLLLTTVASVIKARRHPTARAPCRVAARPLRALRRRAARRSRSTPRSSTRTHS
jgi:predicted tellurium resistance membrane protein TerC